MPWYLQGAATLSPAGGCTLVMAQQSTQKARAQQQARFMPSPGRLQAEEQGEAGAVCHQVSPDMRGEHLAPHPVLPAVDARGKEPPHEANHGTADRPVYAVRPARRLAPRGHFSDAHVARTQASMRGRVFFFFVFENRRLFCLYEDTSAGHNPWTLWYKKL